MRIVRTVLRVANKLIGSFTSYILIFYSHYCIYEQLDTQGSKENKTLYHEIEAFWKERYDFRFNTISKQYEFSSKGDAQFELINDSALFIELQKHGLKIGSVNFYHLLRSGIFPSYNPVHAYFHHIKDLSLEGIDHIEKLACYVATNEPAAWAMALKKWLVRAVRCVFHENYVNRETLTLVGAQRTGKTSFFRFLCPPVLRAYATENISPKEGKDALIALATNFLVNLDEIQRFSGKDVDILKCWMTQEQINVRLPFARQATQATRIASFTATTNAPFLHDQTGTTRFICFEAQSINHDYHNKTTGIKEIDIDKVWAQAYQLYATGFKAELTDIEVKANEHRNGVFRVEKPEEELLATYFMPSAEDEEGSVFMTSTQMIGLMQQFIKINLSPVCIGRAAAAQGFQRVKYWRRKCYGYWVINLTERAALASKNYEKVCMAGSY